MKHDIDIIQSILQPLEFLPELSQFRILKAAIMYIDGKSLELSDVSEDVAFKMLRPMLDDVRRKNAERVERNRRNGRKGGRKKSHKNPENPVGSLGLDKEEKSLIPPTPPINPKEEIYISSGVDNACTREGYDRGKEQGYIRRFREEGLFFDIAKVAGIDPHKMETVFDRFAEEVTIKEDRHTDYADFKRHLINYARICRVKDAVAGSPPSTGRHSVLGHNMEIARQLGLMD